MWVSVPTKLYQFRKEQSKSTGQNDGSYTAHIISVTNCSSQRHLAANRNRSQEGSSGCRNIIWWGNKSCDL